MTKIVIIGSSSSGKTTLAKNISKKLDIDHQEARLFFWEENWKESKLEVFRERVNNFTNNDKWITDGNFASSVSDIVWARADTIIWLDYSLSRTLIQFFLRSIRRSFSGEELWHGNRETLWNSIFRPKSLFLWIITNYKRNRKRFLLLISSKKYPHISFLHFKSPKETESFLSKLEN
jgi:adenylate kinase family enzyme